MPERKYTLNSAEYFTGVCTKRSVKCGMGGSVGSRTDTVKQYKKSKKCKKELKDLKK